LILVAHVLLHQNYLVVIKAFSEKRVVILEKIDRLRESYTEMAIHLIGGRLLESQLDFVPMSTVLSNIFPGD
jgi:hypothetical protein